ncbi:MAG: S41 family peptidase [Bacteroidetes bacterium]|nr:S41 family peptidase [Bacteroidota bacterium]
MIHSKSLKIKFLLIFFVIFNFSGFSQKNNDFEISKNLEIFTTLYRQLHLNYVDEINSGDLMKKGIDAMLDNLDPYTVYIPESDIEDYKLMTTGQYGGVGALIHQKGDYVIISDPYEGFPAFKAGLIPGDKIIEVNKQSAKGKSQSDISSIFKGQPGTTLTVLIEREGETKPIEKVLTREEIKLLNVPYYGVVGKDVGYIKLSSFTMDAGKDVKDAFLKLRDKDKVKSIIIDLRGNGGGLLQEAVNIVNIFVDKGQLVVSTKGKVSERNFSHKTMEQAIDNNIPLVILVDRSSASASEIVSGAIQDLDRGLIVGQKTYGKGLVQNVFPVSYNAQVKITIAKYYIPSGRCIQVIDYAHKDEDGNPGKIPDSLKTAFKTKGGRTVYDGGGIEPDITLEAEKTSNIVISLLTKFLIFDYANYFKRKNVSINSPREFIVTDAIYDDFLKYLNGKDYDYITRSEKNLAELKAIAEKENYFDAIKIEYQALKDKLIHDKNADLVKNKAEIKTLLKMEIVNRYFYQKGSIEASLSDDNEILKAVELLNDTTKYKKILSKSGDQK